MTHAQFCPTWANKDVPVAQRVFGEGHFLRPVFHSALPVEEYSY